MVINEISYKKLVSGDVLEKLKFAYCSDSDSFINSFNRIGISINKNDIANELLMLEDFSKKGHDLDGSLKINGKSISFNINRFIDNIPVRKNIVNNCGMKINFE